MILTTRHLRSMALVVASIGAMAVAGGSASAAGAIPLNGGQEAPAPQNHGARGWFSYEVSGTQLCYTLSVSGLSAPAAAAHIHVGPRNTPGPVVVPLMVENTTTFETAGCAVVEASLLEAIEEDPRAYYVNVHTPTNPTGEIRGQLK